MQIFVEAIRDRKVDTLLAAFPKQGKWFLVSTVPKSQAGKLRPVRQGFTYADVKRGLRPRGDFVDFFFDGDDPFSLFVTETQARPWVKEKVKEGSATFIPPGEPRNPPAFVSWRKEEDRYVVAEIGAPGS